MSFKHVLATGMVGWMFLFFSPAIAAEEDSPCFFETSSGKRINLGGLCGDQSQPNGNPSQPSGNSDSGNSDTAPRSQPSDQVSFADIQLGSGGFVGQVSNQSGVVLDLPSLSYEIVSIDADGKETVILTGQATVDSAIFSTDGGGGFADEEGGGDFGATGATAYIPGRLNDDASALFTDGFDESDRTALKDLEISALKLKIAYGGESHLQDINYQARLDIPKQYRPARDRCDFPWQRSYGRLCGQQANSEK